MPAEPRDPRTDPRPGDVLMKESRFRTVTHVGGNQMIYSKQTATQPLPFLIKFATWRKWAATATVITKGED